MRWEVETWRKLYVAKPPSWLLLSVSARGLGRELLSYCDDEGRIRTGSEPVGRAVAYLLGARPREHKRIAEDVAELVADGYLVTEPDGLVIRNFAVAQARSSSAERTARYRERLRARDDGRHSDASQSRDEVTDPSPSPIRAVPRPSPKKRSGAEAEASRLESESLTLIPLEPISDPVTEICKHWQEQSYHRGLKTITEGRRARVRARLAEGFSVDDLKAAITNAGQDDWLMGRDPKSTKVYDDLETILRDAGQVERLRDLGKPAPEPEGPAHVVAPLSAEQAARVRAQLEARAAKVAALASDMSDEQVAARSESLMAGGEAR